MCSDSNLKQFFFSDNNDIDVANTLVSLKSSHNSSMLYSKYAILYIYFTSINCLNNRTGISHFMEEIQFFSHFYEATIIDTHSDSN